MAGVDEAIVREYFELNGFLVRQMRRFPVQPRSKRLDESIDLLIENPAGKADARRPQFVLFSNELPLIQRAVVFIKPWNAHRTIPGMLRGSSEFIKFLEKEVTKHADELFALPESQAEALDSQPFLKILVLPMLPSHEPHKGQSTALLQEAGVDAVITFRAMLQDIVGKIDVTHNYEKSDHLQLLRLLKNFDMIKSPQMELFSGSKR